MTRIILALACLLLAGAAHAQPYGPGFPPTTSILAPGATGSTLNLRGTDGSELLDVRNGTLTGTIAGPIKGNFFFQTLNGTITGTGAAAGTRPLQSTLLIGPNAQFIEAYGFTAGVSSTADAASPFNANDFVGASSGTLQQYAWPNSRLYGISTSSTLGPSAGDSVGGASARAMYGQETDNILYVPYATTGSGGTEVISGGTPYRSGFNAIAFGTNVAGQVDSAFSVQCAGGGGNINGCFTDMIDLVDLSGMPQGMPGGSSLNHPLQPTGSLIRSEGNLTIANAFDFHNVVFTGSVLNGINYQISGTGRSLWVSERLRGNIVSSAMNPSVVEMGLGNNTDSTTGDCGSGAAKCWTVLLSPGDGILANIKTYQIPLFDPTAPNPASTIPAGTLVTASQTVTLPPNWHSVQYWIIGGGGGGACGYVVTSGTAISGGGGGGGAPRKNGIILATQYPGINALVLAVGSAGTGCTPSGTTNGSSGSGQTAGGNTTVTINSVLVDTAWGGGAGSNGGLTASAGGGSGGLLGAGGNAAGATAGAAGSALGTIGGSGAAGSATSVPWFAGSGSGGILGGLGVTGSNPAGPAGGTGGSGLAATPVSLAGASGGRASPFSTAQVAGGLATCTGTSQNGTNATSNWNDPNGSDLTGASGGSGASCTTSNGGNAGNSSGFGAGGSAGGSTLAGFLAGSGTAGASGAVVLLVN